MADSGGSSSSAATFLGFLSGNNQISFKATATVGLSFFILRFVATAAKAVADESSDADSGDGKARDLVNELLHQSEVLYQFVKNVLQRVILQHGLNRGQLGQGRSTEDDGSEEENVPMIHKGSCHCRAVCFELIAPQRILCKESQNGKIQYRHARIRAKSFRFIRGANSVKMYYVDKQSSKGNDEVGAHSFCSQCGVHFLHAPNSHSTALDVNVDCLNPKDVKIKTAKSKRVNLSAGSAVVDQWEHDPEANSHGYPATIAEEHSPMATMPFDKSSPFAAYKHHPLMRHHNQQEWDYSTADDGTIDLVFPGNDKIPDTPTTVYTTQTEALSSSGVPPTLTLDTRGYNNDIESVVSLSSMRSGYPPLPPMKANPEDSFVGLSSPPSEAAISPSTTHLVRHQMNFYMRKHMSSSGSSVSSLSSRISPGTRNAAPVFPSVANQGDL